MLNHMRESTRTNCRVARSAFTLIEVMVALTVTLLMMGALAQAFSFLGNQMKSGRAELELSGHLRSCSVRIRDELRRITAPIAPPQSVQARAGYFMYYEGPMTDSSTTLYGAQPSTLNESSFQDSRWGDFDDYIAFTAKAPTGSWFTGKVPAFVVNPLAADPFMPVEITSPFAEIIYWVSPEWDRVPSASFPGSHPQNIQVGTNTLPLYRDVDVNNLPDRLVLRRRVLLIRPDLNMGNEQLAIPQTISDRRDDFWFWNHRTPTPITTYPYMVTPLSTASTFKSNWMVGMQLAHQLCDLSVSRVVNPANGMPVTPSPSDTPINVSTSTYPVTGIRANSLADLARPENRFAHVRIPGEYFGFGANQRTTMPILALTGSDAFLTAARYPNTTFDSSLPSPFSVPLFNGFVLPLYELSNYAANSELFDDARLDRTGEDVVATDILAFDVQGFDPLAPLFLHNGPDGVSGPGPVSDFSKQGAAGTDDLILTPDDPGILSVMNSSQINPSAGVPYSTASGSTPEQFPTLADNGAFVDLCYPIQQAGVLKDFWATATPGPPASRVSSYLVTSLSGITGAPLATSLPQATGEKLRKSGRALFRPAAPQNILFQPAYDTYTDAYESDGLNQEANTVPIPVGGKFYGGTWWMLSQVDADEGIDGLDNPGSDPGADEISEHETSPPFNIRLPGVRIRIRMEDANTRQFKQMSVVHDF